MLRRIPCIPISKTQSHQFSLISRDFSPISNYFLSNELVTINIKLPSFRYTFFLTCLPPVDTMCHFFLLLLLFCSFCLEISPQNSCLYTLPPISLLQFSLILISIKFWSLPVGQNFYARCFVNSSFNSKWVSYLTYQEYWKRLVMSSSLICQAFFLICPSGYHLS